MDKKELARQLHCNGHNCCQAVLCAFADDYGLDQELAFRLAEGFGRGFGGRQEVCGAVSAMAMVMGLENSGGKTSMGKTKVATMATVNDQVECFIEKNHTHICKNLLNENGKHRSCNDLIADCAEILEETLKKD